MSLAIAITRQNCTENGRCILDSEINCSTCLRWEICEDFTPGGEACEMWTDDYSEVGEDPHIV